MNAVSKTIIACSIAAASVFGAANASAAPFNQFEVAPLGSFGNFTADKIIGNYVEVATFNSNGTFDVSLLWNASGFATNGGTVALDGRDTGLGNSYGLYALYKASGTVGLDSQGRTTFNFTPGTGSFNMFLDTGAVTRSGPTDRPATGTGNFTLTGNSTDILLASGQAVSGLGTLDPTLSTCTNGAGGNGINCGSFGSETTFALNADGSKFFVAPNPFYTLSFQSGQLNNFTPTGTVVINGSLDVVFDRLPDGEVPEPASVGLLGLGMLGLYAARRRNKKAA